MHRRFHRSVTITSSARECDYKPRIFGKVHPKHLDLQVFVRSLADNKWYKQAPVEKKGTKWSCVIALGFPGCESIGNVFEVIAIASPHIDANVLDELPELEIHSMGRFLLRT